MTYEPGAERNDMTDRPELRKRAANFVPLSPVSFLARAADFFGDRMAVIHGEPPLHLSPSSTPARGSWRMP